MDKPQSKTVEEALNNVLLIHNEKVSRLESQLHVLTQENSSLKIDVANMARTQNKLNQTIKKLQDDLKQNKTALQNEKSRSDQLASKLLKERERVIGWKHKAQQSKNGSNKVSILFDEEVKVLPSVDIYAPMSEQLPEDEKENKSDNEALTVSVGETEFVPVEIRTTDSDVDECPTSPSILTEKRPFKIPSKNPFSASEDKQQRRVFETSDDLFADSTSPFNPRANFCSTLKPDEKPSIPYVNKTTDEKLSEHGTIKSSLANKRPVDSNSMLTIKPVISDRLASSTPISTLGVPPATIDSVSMEPNEVIKPKEQNYRCVEVIRNKADREKLKGFTCHECDKFYANEKLTDDERQKVIDQCSRHRYKEAPPPSTPDDFWAVSFPSTQDYIAKGLMEVDTKSQLQKEKLGREKSRKRIKYQ